MEEEIATFAAGCFWGVEDTFRKVPGVLDVMSGYMGGTVEHPTSDQIYEGKTGHAEVVQITYDPGRVSYYDLLKIFWEHHDPTQLNRQGPDIGDEYRSAIFYHTPDQHTLAEETKQLLEKSGAFKRPITTQIVKASTFWMAEEYHQRFNEKHGRVCPIIKSPAKGIL